MAASLKIYFLSHPHKASVVMTSKRSVSLKVTEVAALSWALSALSLAGVPCGLHGHSLPHLRTNLGSEQESTLKFKASKSLLETIPGLSLCFSCIMLPWFTSHTVSSHHKALSIGGFRGKSVNKGNNDKEEQEEG